MCILISVEYLVQFSDFKMMKIDICFGVFCVLMHFYLTTNCEILTHFGVFCVIVMPLTESLDSPFYGIKVNELIAKRQLTESSVLVLF